MVHKNTFAILIITACVLVSSVYNCTYGKCLQCTDLAGKDYCNKCANGQITGENLTCIDAANKIDGCLETKLSTSNGTTTTKCDLCDKTKSRKADGTACEALAGNPIPDCISHFKNGSADNCDMCENGKAPKADATGCEDPAAGWKIADCTVYRKVTAAGVTDPQCQLCGNSKVLRVGSGTNIDSAARQCDQFTLVEGCIWVDKDDKCQLCDAANGYYATGQGANGSVCSKSSANIISIFAIISLGLLQFF